MFMEKQDRDEIKEFLIQILETHTAKVDGKFDVINTKLDTITTQTTKHNGRMTKAEEVINYLLNREHNHGALCPQAKRIETLEHQQLTSISIKKFLVATLGVTVSIVAILAFVFEVWIK